MTISLWQRLDQAGRSLAPLAVTLMLVLLSVVPLYLPGWQRVAPLLVLMSVYYWTIHRPDLLPPGAVFAVGLLYDLLAGSPLGLTALVLLLCHWMVVYQRGFFLAGSFLMLWTGFSVVVFGAELVQWLACSLLSGEVLGVRAALFQALLSLALFPLCAWLFIRIHRAFLNQG
ncbi:rod shape-determining protein MreD [Azospirillaceae bacterium]